MSKSYYSLGLMSGTSMDGVDASIIQSDGENKFKPIIDEYFEYPKNIYSELIDLRDKITNSIDLDKYSEKINSIEKKITTFHGQAANKIMKKFKEKIDFIGFHGQTIFHNSKEKISKQMGNAKLLSQLTKKNVIYNFRKNDLENGGEGAPLTPVFHNLLKKEFKFSSAMFINIGGIINETTCKENDDLSASDVGPGMCLADKWIRSHTKKKFDTNGSIAMSGKINNKIIEKELEIFLKRNKDKPTKSFDTSDFNNSFVNKLSLEDGVATLIEFSVKILLDKLKESKEEKVILCGGGRKNNFLIDRIRKNNISFNLIDDFNIDGDFIESQAFAYIAIRTHLNLPISFPKTTGVELPCEGGDIIKY